MSGSGRDALGDVREWSGDPPGCPGVVGRHSRMSGSGWETFPDVREAHPDVREWSGGPPKCQQVIGMHSGICGRGLDSLGDVRVLSGGPRECPAVVGRPSRLFGMVGTHSWMSRSSQEALGDVRQW